KPSEGKGVVDGTVPPADVIRILLPRVLRVVEKQVDASDQIGPRGPVRLEGESAYPKGRLVIGQVGERSGPCLDAVADGGSRVAHAGGRPKKRTNGNGAPYHVVQLELAGQTAKHDREEGRRQIAAEPGLQAEGGARRSPDVDLHPRIIEGPEES